MTADGTPGTKNNPQFLDGGAPDLATDANLISAYAAKVGNRRTGTTAERNAATGKDVWEGLEWFDTTLRRIFLYLNGSWVATVGFTNAPNSASGGLTPGGVTVPAGAVIFEQRFYTEFTTGTGGTGVFSFPTAYPNRCGGINMTTIRGSAYNPVVDNGQLSASQARVIFGNTGAVAGMAVYVETWGW